MNRPRYLDNHCHILPMGLDLQKLDLSATFSHEEALESLFQRHREDPDGWLLAVGYDQNRYGGVQLTRTELDRISADRPIALKHSSGHSGVANSAALQLAHITATTPDPSGGLIARDEIGEPTGVLYEKALMPVARRIPMPTREEMVHAILEASESMAKFGIIGASDMQTGSFDLVEELHAYREAAERGAKIAMRLYLQWGRVFGSKAPQAAELQELIGAFEGTASRVQGIKLFADGAIGPGTAAIYGSYDDNRTDTPTAGTLMYSPEVLKQRISTAAEAGWQVSVHAIGDYAADLVMDGFEKTPEPSRHRLEHAMLLSDAQIERLQRLNCFVCLQPEFLGHFGSTYLSKLGPEMSFNLIRFRSLIDAGIHVSFSSDRPITVGDPVAGIQNATDRPEGFNPEENVSLLQAFRAYQEGSAMATEDAGIFSFR